MNERTTGTGDALGDAGVDVARLLARYVIVDMALGTARDVWSEHVVTVYDLGLHIFKELAGSLLTHSTPDERFERLSEFASSMDGSRCRVLGGFANLSKPCLDATKIPGKTRFSWELSPSS